MQIMKAIMNLHFKYSDESGFLVFKLTQSSYQSSCFALSLNPVTRASFFFFLKQFLKNNGEICNHDGNFTFLIPTLNHLVHQKISKSCLYTVLGNVTSLKEAQFPGCCQTLSCLVLPSKYIDWKNIMISVQSIANENLFSNLDHMQKPNEYNQKKFIHLNEKTILPQQILRMP